MECQAIVSKAKCLPDCSIVRQETQEFYCTAAQIYGELKTVRFICFTHTYII